MPHGFTPRQFLKILQAASGRIEEASCGAYICRQGHGVFTEFWGVSPKFGGGLTFLGSFFFKGVLLFRGLYFGVPLIRKAPLWRAAVAV